jgi:hypothetical protein
VWRRPVKLAATMLFFAWIGAGFVTDLLVSQIHGYDHGGQSAQIGAVAAPAGAILGAVPFYTVDVPRMWRRLTLVESIFVGGLLIIVLVTICAL